MPFEPSSKGHSEAQIGRGLFWHDMHIGTTLRTYTRTITETDLVSFVTLTGMIDSGFLDATIVGPMGGRPVPGALTYSIIEGFIVQSLIRGTGIAMLGCTQETIAPSMSAIQSATIGAACLTCEAIAQSRLGVTIFSQR